MHRDCCCFKRIVFVLVGTLMLADGLKATLAGPPCPSLSLGFPTPIPERICLGHGLSSGDLCVLLGQRYRDPWCSAISCSDCHLFRGHRAHLLHLLGAHSYFLCEFLSKGSRFHAIQHQCLETAALLLDGFADAGGDQGTIIVEAEAAVALGQLSGLFSGCELWFYICRLWFSFLVPCGLLFMNDPCCLLLTSFTWAPLTPSTVGIMVHQIPAPLGSSAPTPVTTGSLHFSAQPHGISVIPVVMRTLLSLSFVILVESQ